MERPLNGNIDALCSWGYGKLTAAGRAIFNALSIRSHDRITLSPATQDSPILCIVNVYWAKWLSMLSLDSVVSLGELEHFHVSQYRS